MPVRQIVKKEELLECGRIQSIAFVAPWDRMEALKKLDDPEVPRNTTLGFFDQEEKLTACLELPTYQARYQGKVIPITGVGGVASLPEHRKGGAVRRLFTYTLPWMRDQGAVFSCLYPFSHSFYRKFGYELCQLPTAWQVPAESLRHLPCSCQVDMLQPGCDLSPLKQVYEAYLGQCQLAIQREDRHWRELLGKASYKDRRYSYLFSQEGKALSYVVIQAENDGPYSKAGVVRELAWACPQGLREALGFLNRLAAQYGRFRITLPQGTLLPALVDECYDCKPSCHDQPMARVLQAAEAFRLRPLAQGVRCRVAVEDPFLPENTGVFALTGAGDHTQVEQLPLSEEWDLSVDPGTLTQLLLGTLTLEEALCKPQVALRGNAQALEQAFPKATVFLNEYF